MSASKKRMPKFRVHEPKHPKGEFPGLNSGVLKSLFQYALHMGKYWNRYIFLHITKRLFFMFVHFG